MTQPRSHFAYELVSPNTYFNPDFLTGSISPARAVQLDLVVAVSINVPVL